MVLVIALRNDEQPVLFHSILIQTFNAVPNLFFWTEGMMPI